VLRTPWRLVTARRLLTGGLLLLVAVGLALWIFPSNDYIFLPDRAHPVTPLVHVAGGHDEAEGGIYFVDVVVRKASLLEQLFGGLHEGASLYPASAVVPPGVTGAEQGKVDTQEMRTSQQVAAAVALRALGRTVTAKPSGALVAGVESGLPAAPLLRPTDVIVAANGVAVRTPDDLARVMGRVRPGQVVRFAVRRGAKTLTVSMRTVAAAGQPKRAIVGVLLDQAEDIHLPVRVSIDAHGVGGPSAGLAFALDVLQQLGRDVDHGHRIAATGEIFLNGQVGPIGGIKQKTIGAREAGVDAFLVPAGQNARDARKYANGLRIIPVKSFQQALHALATLPRTVQK